MRTFSFDLKRADLPGRKRQGVLLAMTLALCLISGLVASPSAATPSLFFGVTFTPIKDDLTAGADLSSGIVVANKTSSVRRAHATFTDHAWHLDGDTNFSVPANDGFSLKIKAHASDNSTVRDTLTVTDDLGSTITIEFILNPTKLVTGVHTADTLDVSAPASYTFENTEVGMPIYGIQLPVVNQNPSMIIWDSVSLHGTGFELYPPYAWTGALDTAPCFVSFKPTKAKTYNATIRLCYTDTNQHHHLTIINLSGTAIDQRPENCLSLSGADTVAPGMTDTLFITNNTGAAVIATSFWPNDTSGGWSFSGVSPDTIPDGQVRKIAVTNNHSREYSGISIGLDGDSTLVCDGYYPRKYNQLGRRFIAGYKDADTVVDNENLARGTGPTINSAVDTTIQTIIIGGMYYTDFTHVSLNNPASDPDVFALVDYPNGNLDGNEKVADWIRLRVRFISTANGEYSSSITLQGRKGGSTNIPLTGIRTGHTTVQLGVNSTSAHNTNLVVQPNPASSHLTVTPSGFAGSVEIALIDVLGKVMAKHRTNSNEVWSVLENLPDLTSGTYFLRASGHDDTNKPLVLSQRVVIEP